MKFVPRQPQSPPDRTLSRATTTRFLRLQPVEETEEGAAQTELAAASDKVAEPPPSQPLPLPQARVFIAPARTPSQRVRLNLDPEVATQPLPEAQRPAPAVEPAAASAVAESSEESSREAIAPAEIASDPEAQAEAAAPEAEFTPEQEAAAQSSIENEPVVPPVPEPAPTSTALIRPKLTRPQGSGALTFRTKSGGMRVHAGGASPISLSRMAKGERSAARRRFAPRAPESETATPIVMGGPGATVPSDSQPLPRPELRRPGAKPLSEMARPERSLGPGFWILLILLVALFIAVLYFFDVIPKVATFVSERVHPPVQAPPAARSVDYAVARRTMTPVEIPLSGTIEPFQQTALYARTTGYVRDWLVDIGDMVKNGQVLAELDTPDVDHQLTQARATADEAKAHLTLAQDEAKRWDGMALAHAVSQQDADEKDTARDEAQASFNAAQASVGRLVDMEVFKEIRAPYAGRITSRNLEVGTLVAAGPGTAGSELFRVAQTDPVRIFVEVPEASAHSVQAGLAARIDVASAPDRVFDGTVMRDAGVLDNATHTLRTELRVANPDGALIPGARAGVRLQLRDTIPTVLVPVDTIIIKGEGLSVALLIAADGHDIVHLAPVKIGREFGAEVEVLDNVREGDRLVSHPPSDLKDGTAVNARPMEEAPIPSLLPPKPSAPRA